MPLLLSPHERESLYAGANAAVWHSHQLATHTAKKAVREEDLVATLVSDGVPILADRWVEVLKPRGYSVQVAGVFCHGHPQVKFGSPPERVELADLLVVHHHHGRRRSTARALLLQAKVSSDATHKLSPTDPQLKLYSKWPAFEFVTGGLLPGVRDLKETGRGSRYALVLDRSAFPEDIRWADQCPWAACPPAVLLSADRSLAKVLGDMVLGRDGRQFHVARPRDEWSRTIHELLRETGKRTYRRANIGRAPTPRLAGSSPVAATLFLCSPTERPNASNFRKSTTERMFPQEPMRGSGGGPNDTRRQQRDGGDEGGLSTLIIETSEQKQ